MQAVSNRVTKLEERRLPTWSSRRQQNGAFSANRWHKVGELPMYGELGG